MIYIVMVTFLVLASSASKLHILDRMVAIEAEQRCTQFTPCEGPTGPDQFLSLNMTNCSQPEVQINEGEPLTYTIAFYQRLKCKVEKGAKWSDFYTTCEDYNVIFLQTVSGQKYELLVQTFTQPCSPDPGTICVLTNTGIVSSGSGQSGEFWLSVLVTCNNPVTRGYELCENAPAVFTNVQS
ncbi:unnamed protein product [Allacma fusca]|uniref:Uncharacterized protein n=1 Tax=Allacma fusca TaxID=39272 RepID=A0A8J2JPT6_9HEXA|nr:unnamed protein product [Allacma fusca]